MQCEACATEFSPRPDGDLADLNNLCRSCAAECAAQLDIDYNLPRGSSDEVRLAALGLPPPGTEVVGYKCTNQLCHRRDYTWSTHAAEPEHRSRCYACGSNGTQLFAYYQQ